MTWLLSLVHRLPLALILLLLFCGGLHAQDSRGKDFWVAFMPNLGSTMEESQMSLYLSATRPTTARITYTASGTTITVPLPIANTTVTIPIDTLFGAGVELDDIGFFNQANEITRKSLHVEADDEITLYGVNIRSKSADAFLGLPSDVFTGSYIVLAYPNGYSSGGQNGAYDTPSQFCVIATEDNTRLTVTPAQDLSINRRGQAPFVVTLNRGQVFLGQADVDPDIEMDVSGTQLRANKPVAVFGGNKRTSIPTDVGNYRDCLVEQLPPLDAWGNTALLTPHYPVTPQSSDIAVARIIAAFPGTSVAITSAGGIDNRIVGPDEPIEIPLLRPMTVTASGPILAAQYEHSVNLTNTAIGDPFMMLVVAEAQFDSSYAFQSIVHSEFTDHFINIVIPQEGIASLRLDDGAISSSFKTIPGSRFFYAQVQVDAGSHRIRSDSAFGLYVYGFGNATSYGYPGGTLFRTLVTDFNPPEITGGLDCGRYDGVAYDVHITDSGIDSCFATKDTSNVMLTVDPFAPGADSVYYHVKLIDPFQDGAFGLKVIDSSGRSLTQRAEVPGFTVRVGNAAPATLDTFALINSRGCRQVTIHNYGRHEQKIMRAVATDQFGSARVTTAMPITLRPGDSAIVDVCFDNLPDTVATVSLMIGWDCLDREVALFTVLNLVDTLPPTIGRDGSPCGDQFSVTYTKRLRTSGIVSFHADTAINCTIAAVDGNLPSSFLQLNVERIDPYQDMIYQVTVRDSVGNVFVDRDTIGGFTVAFLDDTGSTVGVRYDRIWQGDVLPMHGHICDSLVLTNYGLRPIDVSMIYMKNNVHFSIPPSQLPLVLGSGDSIRLAICTEAEEPGDMIDTLVLVDGCGHRDEVMMLKPVTLLALEGVDDCNNAISVTAFAPAKRLFLSTPMPNPAGDVTLIDLGLARNETVDLEVLDALGRPALSVLRRIDLASGINRVAFDVSKLDNGYYFCRMTTAAGEVRVEKMVVRR